MNRIKLFITDYDRTLTDAELKVKDRAIKALLMLRESGIKVAVVSGRKYPCMKAFYDRYFEYIDAFIAENGCIGFADNRREIIRQNKNREEILEVLNNKAIPHDDGDVVISVHSIHEKALSKVLAKFEDLRVVKNIDSLMILPGGASKGDGVKWLSRKLGIDILQTACIGDGENDVEMRQSCAILGAVANAVPEMKNAADYVCERSYGGGLLEFVEKVILKSKSGTAK